MKSKKVLKIDDIIKTMPSAQIVTPDADFYEILKDFSWDNFYLWIAKNVNISNEDYQRLHNITYAPLQIYREMKRALRKKFKKKYSTKSKRELDAMVWWSDLGSGCQALINMQYIDGDVFLVIL